MNNVEMLRQRTLRAVMSIGQYASMLPGGAETADLLRGTEGAERLARIVDTIMAELGHPPPKSQDSNSTTRRVVNRVFKAPK